MDALSAAASVVALLGATYKSIEIIYAFFQRIVDATTDVRYYCITIQAFLNTISALTDFCKDAQLHARPVMNLPATVAHCLGEIKHAERRISEVDRKLSANKVRRTWTIVHLALTRGGAWLKKFLEHIELWHRVLTCDLLLLQS